MRIYLAGTSADGTHRARISDLISGGPGDISGGLCLLESFWYVQPWQTEAIHRLKSFMLDSGAYTFAYGRAGRVVDFDEYLERYAAYIVANGVELFMELDVDPIVGYPEVLRMRRRLEDITGRRCIPVWHVERGWDDWLRTCEEYEYVAIGGIADKGRTRVEPYLRALTGEAHKRGAKVHGLGYTSLRYMRDSGLDSVDSSAWLAGNRCGFAFLWDGTTMRKVQRHDGTRANGPGLARHNFLEWFKMAEQMEG